VNERDRLGTAEQICTTAGVLPAHPGVDLEQLAKQLGVKEIRLSAMGEDGRVSTDHRGDVRIQIRHDLPSERKHFTIAHEIGHVLLSMPGEVQLRFRAASRTRNDEERLCDAIAGCLLMPTEWVRTLVPRESVSLAALLTIRQECHVSLTAAAVRLRQVTGRTFTAITAIRDQGFWRSPIIIGNERSRQLNWTRSAVALLENADRSPQRAVINLMVHRTPRAFPAEVAQDKLGAIVLLDGIEFSHLAGRESVR